MKEVASWHCYIVHELTNDLEAPKYRVCWDSWSPRREVIRRVAEDNMVDVTNVFRDVLKKKIYVSLSLLKIESFALELFDEVTFFKFKSHLVPPSSF